jgi:hypothetical protein
MRNLWILPLVGIVALLAAGLWVRSRIDESVRRQTISELTTVLRADVEALKLWMRLQEDNATIVAADHEIAESVRKLVDFAQEHGTQPAQLLQAPEQAELSEQLKPWVEGKAYTGFVVFDAEGVILASDQDVLLGQPALGPEEAGYAAKLMAGQPIVSHPFPSRTLLPSPDGQLVGGVPVMFVAAPVADAQGKTVAVVALRIDPGEEFSQILSVAQLGTTGETYAFNDRGLLLSESRFDDDLKRLALLPDQPYASSVLTLELRDPGVDMTTGARPAAPRSEQPLTAMTADAIKRRPPIDDPAVNVEGVRDYRGVEVVGAWAWLPEYDFGIATKLDASEAFQPVFVLRNVFWVLLVLLGILTLMLLLLALLARRLERRVREAVVAAGQLGQYSLEEKIGAGGMGSVYRARHAMLRRPTAVKLLEPAKTTDVSVARFEREVQLTSQLNHPNTITIYDYGRTAEGVFYYAMELLEGYSLDVLVQRFGPLPDGRVIGILSQLCGSLIEAHQAGLIHRDIKPANIMVTQRGGVYDFVKLLDFGLVKAIDSRKQKTLTAADTITGTPLYMAPETIRDSEGCDARGDLYALGAVGYYLLCGRPMFESNSVMAIMRAHVETRPTPPSQKTTQPICAELERLILRCLEKSPSDRPQSAAELLEALSACSPARPWTKSDAALWWTHNQVTIVAEPSATVTEEIEPGATLGYSEVRPSR